MQGNANSRAEKPVLNQDHTGMEPEKGKSRKSPPGETATDHPNPNLLHHLEDPFWEFMK